VRSVRRKYGVVGLPELAVRCSEQIWQTVIAKLEFEGHEGYLRLLLEELLVASWIFLWRNPKNEGLTPEVPRRVRGARRGWGRD
jgi:hypothetical protein